MRLRPIVTMIAAVSLTGGAAARQTGRWVGN
jgi:hypothetical protein